MACPGPFYTGISCLIDHNIYRRQENELAKYGSNILPNEVTQKHLKEVENVLSWLASFFLFFFIVYHQI